MIRPTNRDALILKVVKQEASKLQRQRSFDGVAVSLGELECHQRVQSRRTVKVGDTASEGLPICFGKQIGQRPGAKSPTAIGNDPVILGQSLICFAIKLRLTSVSDGEAQMEYENVEIYI